MNWSDMSSLALPREKRSDHLLKWCVQILLIMCLLRLKCAEHCFSDTIFALLLRNLNFKGE